MQANPDKFHSLISRCNQVAVPIFHAYAHEASCQHKYSPRNLVGFGLLDGENIERLWSFLGRFSRMTKEMTPANRVDVLTDALCHYCTVRASKLGMKCFIPHYQILELFIFCLVLEKACVERYSTAMKKYKSAKEEISSILLTSGVDGDHLFQIETILGLDEERRLGRIHEPLAYCVM